MVAAGRDCGYSGNIVDSGAAGGGNGGDSSGVGGL